MSKPVIVLAALSLVAVAILAYGAGRDSGRNAGMNVVIIVLDATKPEHLGCYGYPRDTSPNIDKLCERSIVFDDAVTQAIWTKPSVATIFTSEYPSVHGTFKYSSNVSKEIPNNVLPDSETTVAEVLSREGYATAAFVSNPFLRGGFNLKQGFGTYEFSNGMLERENDRALAKASLEWMRQRGDGRFFAYIHLMAAHGPYDPPPDYAARFRPAAYGGTLKFDGFGLPDQNYTKEDLDELNARYDGNIAYTDEMVREILASLQETGRLEDTIIVITADHGESLGEHGHTGHSRITKSVIDVPLIIYDPLEPEGRRIKGPVGLIDLSPTILAMLNIKAPAGFQGKNILNEQRGYAVIEGYGASNHDKIGLTDGRLLYVISDQEKLYDLQKDPQETTDISGQNPELTQKYRQILSQIQKPNQTTQATDENDKEKLKALGYVN